MTFLAVLVTVTTSDDVSQAFFLNSATKKLISFGCNTPGPPLLVTPLSLSSTL